MTNEELLEKVRELVEKNKEQHACPNCGHCPHCGRQGMMPVYVPNYPVYPYPWWGVIPPVNVPSVWYSTAPSATDVTFTTFPNNGGTTHHEIKPAAPTVYTGAHQA